MPPFQYFGWVGSCLLAALFAANWCFSSLIALHQPPTAPSQNRARAKDLLSPIRFTGRQEEADAFAHESGQLAAQLFRALAHQSPHQHREQNKIHENLRRGEASFRAEWSLGAARKRVGGIVQDMGNGSGSPIPPGFVDVATERGESVCLGYRGACNADRLLDESFHDLDAETRELVLHRTSLGLKALEIRQSPDDAAHDRLEQCLLSREVGIDRRLACRRHLRDLVEARALITSLEEYPLGRIEDPRFHIARQVFGRDSETRPFQIIMLSPYHLHPH